MGFTEKTEQMIKETLKLGEKLKATVEDGHVIHTSPPLNELPFSPPPPWPRPQRTINTEKRKFMMDYVLTLADNGMDNIPDFLDAIETLYNEIVKRSRIDQPKKHEEKAEEDSNAL